VGRGLERLQLPDLLVVAVIRNRVLEVGARLFPGKLLAMRLDRSPGGRGRSASGGFRKRVPPMLSSAEDARRKPIRAEIR